MSADAPDERSTLPHVELYTDGACLGNPGPGGWAYILRHAKTGQETEEAGGDASTTNNRMELIAVLRGLEALKRPSRVELCADSEYVVKGIREWLPGWKRRGWRRAGGKPVNNADLWQRMDELLGVHDVRAGWTRAHAGHEENERVDSRAFAEAEARRDGRR